MTQHQEPSADERIAGNVRALREQREMSQSALAKAMSDHGLQWHQQTVYKVENGTRPLRAAELAALARILKTSLDRFMWTGAEANESAAVYDAAATLRARWDEASIAVRRLLAARAHGERILAGRSASTYERVRLACRELAADLAERHLENAVGAGIERHENQEP